MLIVSARIYILDFYKNSAPASTFRELNNITFMKIIDLHQDLMTHMRFKDVFGQEEQTSLSSILTSDIDVVIATAFPMPPNDNQLHASASDLITEELQLYRDFVDTNDAWSVLLKSNDFDLETQKVLLHIEGLNLFDGSAAAWKQLEGWHGMGVRSIGTHWNIANQLGGGTLQPDSRLTSLGAEVISYLEDQKIIFDMAHMGRQTFWDAAKLSKRPLYVSHGNADAICSNVRNYTDEQLQAIAGSGGVMGVFFPNTFVAGAGAQGSIDTLIDHVDHMKAVMGIEHIALGSDFGGIVSGTIQGLSKVSDLENLAACFGARGYSESEIEHIFYANARRVLESHLG